MKYYVNYEYKEYNVCDLNFTDPDTSNSNTEKENRIIATMKADIKTIDAPLFNLLSKQKQRELKAKAHAIPLKAWIN